MKQKLFSKDFTLVIIGQIISLFGNAAVRCALPLYLLNYTGSSALYGTVTACAFVPAILLSPVGGMIADRVNKKNIMVILDFFTAAVILTFLLLMGKISLILLMIVTLMLLYGIAGAYQPSVQASVPALVSPEQFVAANSVINTISSFASLLGPVLGGILYSAYGIKLVLWVCAACFLLSAAMEIFINIPFVRQDSAAGVWETIRKDFAESVRFIRKEKPAIGKGLFTVSGINLFLASMIMVGVPYLVTEVLPFNAALASKLCGFAEGALAAGGLTGGILAGVLAKKLSVKRAGNLIMACAGCVLAMGMLLLFLLTAPIAAYAVLVAGCFGVMLFSSIFTVLMFSFVQSETPQNLIGKVVALMFTVSMCAQPLGNILYGVLFEVCQGYEFIVVLFSGVVSMAIAAGTKNIFREIS